MFLRHCPADHVCLPGLGSNPNFGYTNFDTFPWSMLTTFQLITLDYWENIYNMVRECIRCRRRARLNLPIYCYYRHRHTTNAVTFNKTLSACATVTHSPCPPI